MLSNILSLLGILVSLASCYFAYKAFSTSKEISFPENNPRENICLLKNFSEDAIKFERFLSKHKHKKVYLSIEFDGSEFEVGESGESDESEKSKWLAIWTSSFEPLADGEKPSSFNSHGYQLTVVPHEGGFGGFYWYKGAYRLSGHFYIEGYLGPYQGMMSAVVAAAKTI